MAYTFVNLQDRALDFNYGTADRTRIKSFINMAYRDLCTRHRWSFLESSAAITATAGNKTTSLSSITDLLEPGRLRPNSATTLVEPEYVPWYQYDENYHRKSEAVMPIGQPQQYSIYNGNIYWSHNPDATYTYALQYWKMPTDLSNDTDVALIPESHRDVLVFGALKYAAMRDNDLPRMQQYEAQYEGMVAKLWRMDQKRHKENPNRIPMPSHYGNMYR